MYNIYTCVELSPPHDLLLLAPQLFCVIDFPPSFIPCLLCSFGVFTLGRISAAFPRWACVAGFTFRSVTGPVSMFLAVLISWGLVRSDTEKLGARFFGGRKRCHHVLQAGGCCRGLWIDMQIYKAGIHASCKMGGAICIVARKHCRAAVSCRGCLSTEE